jgi:hypothetical protein
VIRQKETKYNRMKTLFRLRTYLLIILYNAYFFSSLAKGYSIDLTHSEQSSPPAQLTVALDPTSVQPYLPNGDNETLFKIKPNQIKKVSVIITTQFFILKTYVQHNDLHFNIPLICYKFAISQHTADG